MVASATLVEEFVEVARTPLVSHEHPAVPKRHSPSSPLAPPSTAEGEKTIDARLRPLPTYEALRRAVPRQCFEKSLPISIAYLVWDLAILAALYWIVPIVEAYAGWPGLLVWYYVMGMFVSSLFIVGHDCGHTTFSNYTWCNDLFGHIAHAPLMAPYWPWQASHRQHHQYTAHLTKDRGHPWQTAEQFASAHKWLRHFTKLPISSFFRWNPIYTFIGLPDGSHFWPFSPLHANKTERVKCAISGLACAVCAWIAFALCDYSVYNWLKYYYLVLLAQGHWMIMITFLQHHAEDTEVYEASVWNYVRGQAQTIDLVYGFGIDTMIHHISDGHVAHHFFFTKIPHYHLIEATKAISKVLADYPGVYKRRTCYATLYEFLRLNVKLDYLVGRGTGILRYASSAEKAKIN